MNRILDRIMAVLALIGLGITCYLTYVHYLGLTPICVGGGHGCEIVQSSVYSKILGIPVVLPGVIGYALILAVLLVPALAAKRRLLLLALTGAGFAFSIYLSYIGLVVIGATCIWCLSSATIMTVLFVLSALTWVNEDSAVAEDELDPAQ